jgi:hypothetical protein
MATRCKHDKQAMCVECNIEGRSCNHCCRGKAIVNTYSELVSVALCIQYAVRVRRIVICGLPGSAVFFFTLSHNGTNFGIGHY